MPKNLIAKKLVISTFIMGAASFSGQAADTANRGANVDGHIIGNIQIQHDRENAMDDDTLNQLKKCVRAIYNKVPTLRSNQVDNAYNEVLNFINSQECKNKLRAQPANAPQLPRTNPVNKPYAEMYRNAHFALTGLQGPQVNRGHYQVTGIPSNENIGDINTDRGSTEINMKDLLARVWTLISTHQNLQDVAKMRSLLLQNLNDCVEDDGHLVCNLGKSERLMQSIEGFIEGVNFAVILPEVDTFCAAYVTELFEKLDPTDPLQFFITFDIPDNFSIENLEERIKKEREAVEVRINGIYGANSPKAYTAIEKMEDSFNNWKEMHYQNNDNLTAEQKIAGKQAVVQKAAADKQSRQEARRAIETRQAAERPAVQPVRPAVQPVRPVVQPVRPAVQPVRPVVQSVRPVVQPRVQPVVQAPVQHLTPKQVKAAQRAAARQNKAVARQNKAAQRALVRQNKAAARQNKVAQRAAVRQNKAAARQNKVAQRAAARQNKVAQRALVRQAKAAQRAAAQQAKQARRAR